MGSLHQLDGAPATTRRNCSRGCAARGVLTLTHMKTTNDDASTRITQEWHPSYWEKDTHGSAWEKVKGAMQRDWEQTKSDLHVGGTELKQDLVDTLKQATGAEPIPADGLSNPDPVTKAPIWAEAEAGVRYGYGAQRQYGVTHEKWSDALEVKLSTEWDEEKTGKPFALVRPYVRHGWNSKS